MLGRAEKRLVVSAARTLLHIDAKPPIPGEPERLERYVSPSSPPPHTYDSVHAHTATLTTKSLSPTHEITIADSLDQTGRRVCSQPSGNLSHASIRGGHRREGERGGTAAAQCYQIEICCGYRCGDGNGRCRSASDEEAEVGSWPRGYYICE